MTFSQHEKTFLLDTAIQSIEWGLVHHRPRIPEDDEIPPLLRDQGASFVTLAQHEQLRGCIGTTEAYQPLAKDVAEHAFAAAFRDPRFPPLTSREWPETTLEISVLTPPEPMAAHTQEELLEALEPGEDGLILESGHHKATFLASVWEQLPEKHEFVTHLMRKAGLPANAWPEDMKAYRYRSVSIA